MKWAVSFERTVKWGRWQKPFLEKRIKNKEEKNRNCLIGWGYIVNLVWDEKAWD